MNLLNSLRRRPRSGRYLPEVDGLRFLAIAWVVIGHVYHYWSGTLSEAQLSQAGWPENLRRTMQHFDIGVPAQPSFP